MNELDKLLEIYDLMFEDTDTSNERYLDTVVDEGRTLEFLEIIRERPLHDQVFFLSALIKFRPECRSRLLELSQDHSEDIQVWANAGLLYTDKYSDAIEFLKQKIYDRLDDDSLNEGEWPIHFILDFFADPKVEGRAEALHEIAIRARKTKNANPQQIETINTYVKAYADQK